jgi:hypothetical protein
MDRLAPMLTRIDNALIDWSNNDGLAPLGLFLFGFARGVAISGWFALLGVLIGTCIGLPATLLGGVGLAILILALVIVIVAVWLVRKKFAQSPPSSPRHSIDANGQPIHPHSVNVTINPVYPNHDNQPAEALPVAQASPMGHHGAAPRNMGSPHNGAAIEVAPASDAEVLYLRGLALLHGSPGRAKDPQQAANLIMQAASLGYAPAQEHVRQLFAPSQQSGVNNDPNMGHAGVAAGSPPVMPRTSMPPAFAVHPST